MEDSILSDAAFRVIAPALGLGGFAASAAAGLLANNSGSSVLLRAVAAMFACYFVGCLLGWAARVVVHEHVAAQKAAAPMPDIPDFGNGSEDVVSSDFVEAEGSPR